MQISIGFAKPDAAFVRRLPTLARRPRVSGECPKRQAGELHDPGMLLPRCRPRETRRKIAHLARDQNGTVLVVPLEGLEPPLPCEKQILRLWGIEQFQCSVHHP